VRERKGETDKIKRGGWKATGAAAETAVRAARSERKQWGENERCSAKGREWRVCKGDARAIGERREKRCGGMGCENSMRADEEGAK
jgi:hypothetical protein